MKKKLFKVNPNKKIGARSNAPFFIFVSFAAVLSVVVLGYIKITDYSWESAGKAEDVSGAVRPIVSLQERMQKKVYEAMPDGGKGMVFPSAEGLYGRWYTNIGERGIAELVLLSSGEYELVYVSSPQSRRREFSRGNYRYDVSTGYLGLFPERGAKPSKSYDGVVYRVVTMRSFQMALSRKPGDKKFYMSPHKSDLAAKSYHPLFFYESHERVPLLEFMPVVQQKKD